MKKLTLFALLLTLTGCANLTLEWVAQASYKTDNLKKEAPAEPAK
jgi:hypothetical protein